MNILLKTKAYFNKHILGNMRKRYHKLVSFGFHAFSLQPFTSLNGNARKVIANRSTAESKLFRLLSKGVIGEHFLKLTRVLNLVQPTDTVIVDISTFCGFEVLTVAKQTMVGRALPVYFALMRYPITDPTSQNHFVIQQIQKLTDTLGFSPALVFDRGFISPTLIEFLVQKRIIFYLRMKQDKHVVHWGKEIPIRNLPWSEKDAKVRVYGTTLRVVVSEKTGKHEEPWYIFTNDFDSSHAQIIATYYFRFEIEETFKDLKHIFKLKKFKIKKEQSFAILLWFYILAIWIAFLLERDKKANYFSLKTMVSQHKRLSVLRLFHEAISRCLLQPTLKKTLLYSPKRF